MRSTVSRVLAALSLVIVTAQSPAEEKYVVDANGFKVMEQADRLMIFIEGVPVTSFVFRDAKIKRPYFAHVRTLLGKQVTRKHPPVPGVDQTDHDTMHPGIWLAFGDINGQDFWRNKAVIEQVRFVKQPTVSGERLSFTTESKLLTEITDAEPLGLLKCEYEIQRSKPNWWLVWRAEFQAGQAGLVFGDQEEMGLGVRLATPLTEKHGGTIVNSAAQITAAKTWGQPAAWCDASGIVEGELVGVTIFSSPKNFRESWWHNRDYGLMVANPFGRAAMKQGEPSAIKVTAERPLILTFAVCIHHDFTFDPATMQSQFWKGRSD